MTIPATYGDVTGEYLALRREAAVVPSTHDLVWVRGPDAVGFLDGLLSQDLTALPAGTVTRSLLLSPQGKLRATLFVLGGADAVGLIADAGVGPQVIEDLARFKIRVAAEIDPEPSPMSSLIGPRARSALAETGNDVEDATWRDGGAADHATDEVGGATVVHAPYAAAGLTRYLIEPPVADALVESSVGRAGSLAATAVRIEAGEPVMGHDIDDTTIPQEAAVVDDAVSFTKGCYLGQELVARIDSRGHVNRHLRGLVLFDTVVPPVGATVVAGDKAVGTVTSVAESLDLRAPVGLALVRREVAPGDDVTLRWDGGEARATVRALPLIADT